MNPTTYRTLCSYAGSRLLWSHPWPVPAVVPFPLHVPAAVYVVVDDDDRCCYVGSVYRRSDRGLADRLAEHLEDPAKRVLWHIVWVLPLHPHTGRPEVRRIEGVVGAHLRPHGSRRLPVPQPPDVGAVRRGGMLRVRQSGP